MKQAVFFILLYLFAFTKSTFSQKATKIDTLEYSLKFEQPDTFRLQTLNKLIELYSERDSGKTIIYYNKSITLAKKNNNIKYLVRAYLLIGEMYLYTGHLNSAEKKYQQVYQLSRSKKYLFGLAQSMRGLGIVEDHQGNYSESSKYFKKYLNYSKEENDSTGIASAYHALAMNSTNREEYDKSLFYEKKSLSIITRQKDKLREKATVLNSIGVIYLEQSMYLPALEYLYEALEVNVKTKNLLGQSRNYNNIGIIYLEQEEYNSALKSFEKALEIKEKINDVYGKAYTLSRIGELYNLMNKPNKSMNFLQSSLLLRKKIGDIDGVARSYMLLGNLLLKENNFQQAKDTLNKALEIFKEVKRPAGQASVFLSLGMIEIKQENYSQAISFLNKSYDVVTNFNDHQLLKDISKNLAEAYSKTGNYKKAFEFHKIYKESADSVLNEKNTKKLTQKAMQFQFDAEKAKIELEHKEQSLRKENELRKQRLITYGSIGFVLVLFVILLLVYRNNRLKNKTNQLLNAQKQEIELQAKELAMSLQQIKELTDFKEDLMHMIVHDLKNPLNLLLDLPESFSEEEKNVIQKQSVHKMLNLVMNILDVKKYEDTVPKITSKNFAVVDVWNKILDQHQFSISLKNISLAVNDTANIKVYADIELTERIFSNLISNAIKYTPRNGKISLNCEIQENFIKILISDTGVGIPKEKLANIFEKYVQTNEKEYSHGLGLAFCKLATEAHGGSIGIDSEVDQGTTVWFTLPKVLS